MGRKQQVSLQVSQLEVQSGAPSQVSFQKMVLALPIPAHLMGPFLAAQLVNLVNQKSSL